VPNSHAGPPWAKIKKEYLEGVKPKALGAKYGLTAKQVSDKATGDGWVRKKTEILEKTEELAVASIQEVQQLAILAVKKALNEYLAAKASTKFSKGTTLVLQAAIKMAWPDKDSSKPKRREIPEDIKSMDSDAIMDAINEHLDV